jgi:hypothetical protein
MTHRTLGGSQNWGVSKFDAANVSPHRLRKALGEYRKQNYKNDYISPLLPEKISQASYILEDDRDMEMDDNEKVGKVLRFDETIDS